MQRFLRFLFPILTLTVFCPIWQVSAQNYDESLSPFYHGVASGDPLTDAIIIWTRVTPPTGTTPDSIRVQWHIATDTALANIVQSGEIYTKPERDYTVKVDVTGLQAGAHYYYGFTALGAHSLTGRTKTAPSGDVARLRFGVAACSKYGDGYFNSYALLAQHNDLDAVIHVGDYIYEYAPDSDDDVPGRSDLSPDYEIITVADYRTRYAFYRLDPDLRRVHQQHPFINVWDDHESANNSWFGGASNHQSATEGDWFERKAAANQVYFEWLPIRRTDSDDFRSIYRSFSYGNLADVIMLDTRLEGRLEQTDDSDPAFDDPDRTILGTEQYDWLINELGNSQAKWRVIGNQVVFTPLNTLGVLDNFDGWDGYYPEREKVLQYVENEGIDNIVFVTGDIHIGLAGDVAADPFNAYDPATGDGALAVEMVTPGITSDNLDETLPALDPTVLEPTALNINPHGKFVNFTDNGFFILDLNEQQAQGDWYWVDTLAIPSTGFTQQQSWYTLDGENFLQEAAQATPPLENEAVPAPQNPPLYTGIANLPASRQPDLEILSCFPNPSHTENRLVYRLAKAQNVKIELYNAAGKLITTLYDGFHPLGEYQRHTATANLAKGAYYYQLSTEYGKPLIQKITVVR